jgi:hypothetical protein
MIRPVKTPVFGGSPNFSKIKIGSKFYLYCSYGTPFLLVAPSKEEENYEGGFSEWRDEIKNDLHRYLTQSGIHHPPTRIGTRGHIGIEVIAATVARRSTDTTGLHQRRCSALIMQYKTPGMEFYGRYWILGDYRRYIRTSSGRNMVDYVAGRQYGVLHPGDWMGSHVLADTRCRHYWINRRIYTPRNEVDMRGMKRAIRTACNTALHEPCNTR